MTWNYRVMKRTDKTDGEVTFGIYEVYYNKDGKINSYTAEDVGLIAATPFELGKRFEEAMSKPILDYNVLEAEFELKRKQKD